MGNGGLESRAVRLGHIAGIRGRESNFGLGAVELPHHIGANRPGGDLGRRGLLALAVRPLVGAADELAFDQDVRALLDRRRDVFGEPRTEDRDSMPLGLRDPFVVAVFPGALRGDGKNGELRTVAFRFTLLRVRTNKPDESY